MGAWLLGNDNTKLLSLLNWTWYFNQVKKEIHITEWICKIEILNVIYNMKWDSREIWNDLKDLKLEFWKFVSKDFGKSGIIWKWFKMVLSTKLTLVAGK